MARRAPRVGTGVIVCLGRRVYPGELDPQIWQEIRVAAGLKLEKKRTRAESADDLTNTLDSLPLPHATRQ